MSTGNRIAGYRNRHATPEDLQAMSQPTARELIEAIRTRNDTDAAIIGTNLAARVEKVLALHSKQGWVDGGEGCKHCGRRWPCPTVRLLDGADE